MNTLGLYVHYPFCESKCPYCDFVSLADAAEPRGAEYLRLAERELALWRAHQPMLKGAALSSIYFGGGTPSLAPPESIGGLIEAARRAFDFQADMEITLEANPHSADIARFRDLRGAGINRLSIGIQSFADRELRALGRAHTSAQAAEALDRARQAGFENLSADLIFGIPRQTLRDFKASLERMIAFRPEHLSVYGLTLYAGTEFHRRHAQGRLRVPGDEAQARMFLGARRRLVEAGYEHYEISNYALPGRHSRHNRLYWNGGQWLGLGVSAHSALDGARWENPPVLQAWAAPLRGDQLAARPEAMPRGASAVGEFVMLGLRQSEGISLDGLEKRFGAAVRAQVERKFAPLVAEGLAEARGNRRVLSERGVLVADAVMAQFF